MEQEDHGSVLPHDAQHTIQENKDKAVECELQYLKEEPLPPPLPDPQYSFHRRVLPNSLMALTSPEGRQLFAESLGRGMADAYFPLAQHCTNQSEPAFCGITTLLVVLNACGVDPNVRWKGGWRYWGNEEMLLNGCCFSAERVARAGITLDEFAALARCRGPLHVTLKRPNNHSHGSNGSHHDDSYGNSSTAVGTTLEDFRSDIRHFVQNPPKGASSSTESGKRSAGGFLVVSFGRSSLGQTGDGHFSPVAAYHEETDRVLILDVARFKYAPYWVSVPDLYAAMEVGDEANEGKSRGWFLLHPPLGFANPDTSTESRRPAAVVPVMGDPDPCPASHVKIEYCPANHQLHPTKDPKQPTLVNDSKDGEQDEQQQKMEPADTYHLKWLAKNK
jgi:glutathione gamma-glutamylcysteinyltransferase